MRKKLVVPVFIVIWLLIGAFAAGQRGYYTSGHDCGSLGSTFVTIFVGPLNYFGVNPEIQCPSVPQPSE